MKHAWQVWEEMAKEISKIQNMTNAQCQQKMKYLKDWYKVAKDHNCDQTGKPRHSTTK